MKCLYDALVDSFFIRYHDSLAHMLHVGLQLVRQCIRMVIQLHLCYENMLLVDEDSLIT